MIGFRPVYAYNLTVGVASVTGARVVPVGTAAVRLTATTDCYVTIAPAGGFAAAAPSATGSSTGGILIKAASTNGECFKVSAGDQISVIQSSAGGLLNVVEMSQ
jgi:hypothetical protein